MGKLLYERLSFSIGRDITTINQNISVSGQGFSPGSKFNLMFLGKLCVDHSITKFEHAIIALRNNMNSVNIAFVLQIFGDLCKTIAFFQHDDINIIA